jgi:hypothetical protein
LDYVIVAQQACQRLASGNQDRIWYDPGSPQRTILLLPTPNAWETLAYINWYGSDQDGTPVAMAFLKEWQELYQADLVHHYGTILQFLVHQPPTQPEDAFELAWEQFVLAPWILQATGMPLRIHAHSLVNNNFWYLPRHP